MPDSSKSPAILVIDDDADLRYSLRRVLSSRGYQVLEADNGEAGVAIAESSRPQVVLLDNRMEGLSGIQTLQRLKGRSPSSMVILMTAFGTTQTAIEAMKYGAFDYVMKPFDPPRILSLVDNALGVWRQSDTAVNHSANCDWLESEDMIGNSELMQAVFKTIGQVAASDVTVLITGESGTGKERVAQSIHRHSLRSQGPFVAVNCAAIPESLIESELFGHEKGAFTGATAQRIGKFEGCHGGTIFLDEIGDMSLPTQTKVLRAIQEGEIQRVGGSKPLRVDVRVVAATNKNLEKMVANGTFREDLYYRLNVVRLRLPPLRERKEDIPALVDFILQRLAKRSKSKRKAVSAEALRILVDYRWPGNVRELENVIQRCAAFATTDTILPRDLPAEIVTNSAAGGAPTASPGARGPDSLQPAGEGVNRLLDDCYAHLRKTAGNSILVTIEKEMVQRALDETGGNLASAARILGMTRTTLRKRISS